MIYIDPPYGIKYDSNFQQRVDSTKNDEKDQADDVLTIKAFRDTWAMGIHSYLSYLQERLYLCRELLAETGSIFVQMGDDNVHLVRGLMAEVFGSAYFVAQIVFVKTTVRGAGELDSICDHLVWYCRDRQRPKFQAVFYPLTRDMLDSQYNRIETPDGEIVSLSEAQMNGLDPMPEGRRFRPAPLSSQGESGGTTMEPFDLDGVTYRPPPGRHWSVSPETGLPRLQRANRLMAIGKRIYYKRFGDDFPLAAYSNVWLDTRQSGFRGANLYVVQTGDRVVERCIAMTTSPGDLVLDPTCGSGTTAFCAERLGRRWITCDTSRVAVNVARQRLLSGVFDHYKTRNGTLSSNFVYKTVDRVTLKSLAYDLEPEKVELVDQPEVDKDAIRVTGPFEVASLGRYSVEDWKGYVVAEGPGGYGEPAKLENYIEVICRLYRKEAAVQGASGLVHAVVESEKEKIAISVGPLSGRVTAKQINDAVQDALASGILEVHILGWAFEANVGEVKSQLESRGRVRIELIMIRPDTLAEGLKVTQPEMLFSPLALPDIEVRMKKNGRKGAEASVTLKGVALFDRKRRTTEYKRADSGYVSAWYLDEDYDGDCFVDCQMFFDFKKAPNLKAALKAEIEPEEFRLQLTSQTFPVRGYKRIAVKVVDVYGNESTVVRVL